MNPLETHTAPASTAGRADGSAKLLALDTSTERLVLALTADAATFTHESEGGAMASAQLIPQLLALLASRQVALADLDAIAFGRGPGAFTGLRTAVSVAQGLAFGAGKPVLAIDSLQIVADDARGQWLREAPAAAASRPDRGNEDFAIWVAMDARMDQVYAAAYRWRAATSDDTARSVGWRVTDEPALYDLETLNARWAERPPAHLAGSALAAFAQRLHAGTARTWPAQQDRAAALARLSRAAWAAGVAVPADQALPLYLRDKVAQTTAERAAQRDAKAVALQDMAALPPSH